VLSLIVGLVWELLAAALAVDFAGVHSSPRAIQIANTTNIRITIIRNVTIFQSFRPLPSAPP
jgi:hypothetical protein